MSCAHTHSSHAWMGNSDAALPSASAIFLWRSRSCHKAGSKSTTFTARFHLEVSGSNRRTKLQPNQENQQTSKHPNQTHLLRRLREFPLPLVRHTQLLHRKTAAVVGKEGRPRDITRSDFVCIKHATLRLTLVLVLVSALLLLLLLQRTVQQQQAVVGDRPRSAFDDPDTVCFVELDTVVCVAKGDRCVVVVLQR